MFPKRREPTHPGVILKEEFLKPLNLTTKAFAEKLGGKWTEIHIMAIIEGKEGIGDKAATDFARVLGTDVQFWRRLDQQYSQWREKKKM